MRLIWRPARRRSSVATQLECVVRTAMRNRRRSGHVLHERTCDCRSAPDGHPVRVMIVYSMSASADGYVNGPDGTFDWSVPSEELHRFHNQRVAETGAQLLGRRLYETMVVWETQEWDDPTMAEFAKAWRALEKVVFSTTLTHVEGNA